MVATLVSDFGNLSDAEDAAQEAVEQALTTWPETGIPSSPGAWLTTVARRRSIDRLRRSSKGTEKTELAARLEQRVTEHTAFGSEAAMDAIENETLLRDEQLRLLFACCHPSLRPEAQMALTLRSIGGLTTSEIARAFVVPEPTVAQRLVRAKKKIAGAGIPFRIPPDEELLPRTALVRTIVYLIFNEGYEASSGDDLIRDDLCKEAIRLAKLVVDLTPDDAESLGLLALLQLIHSRSAARVSPSGDLVLLADQDRNAWNPVLITSGTTALDRALRLDRPGPLQIQAAIQALHCEAPTSEDTDWEQIELLYRRLSELQPTPVVSLNHAVAVAMTNGPQAGLDQLAEPELASALASYPHFHSARADLLRTIDPVASKAAYRRALALTESEPERRFLERRIAELSDEELS